MNIYMCSPVSWQYLTWAFDLFWSSRVILVKFWAGIDGAYFLQIKAFVFAGFPTTSTFGTISTRQHIIAGYQIQW